jgi:hypothetical protein
MNDSTYDISHLLALDTESLVAGPLAKAGQVVPPTRTVPRQLTAGEVQDALSRELLRTAEFHEALIQQYLRTRDNPFQDIPGVGGSERPVEARPCRASHHSGS